MNRTKTWAIFAFVSIGLVMAVQVRSQSFGTLVFKDKVTLVRKLPAAVHLTGATIKIKVTGHDDQSDLVHDLQALLETELLKDDPQLRVDQSAAATIVTCQITSFAHPQPTTTTRASMAVGKNAAKTQAFLRVTGELGVAFQAKSSSGQVLVSDNVRAKYDREFDSNGNTTSNGIKGTMSSAWSRITGGAASEDLNPPTDSELRGKLTQDAVRQIAEHIVNTKETIEVFLAKQKGGLDDGDKLAQAGLWQRALEAFETTPPLPKTQEDAYRLYNIGVAYEALAYQAEDEKSAMKYLDEAAIDYGKAIDQKPAEKYFLEPQKRIETAIAHYRMLDEQKNQKAAPATVAKAAGSGGTAASGSKTGSASKPLTNGQIVAMVKAGMEDDTVAATVRSAKAVNFDLSAAGQQDLSGNGVSANVLAAMKTRAARKPAAGK
jgi:tetratricopeptide (TPR) repeat protein